MNDITRRLTALEARQAHAPRRDWAWEQMNEAEVTDLRRILARTRTVGLAGLNNDEVERAAVLAERAKVRT